MLSQNHTANHINFWLTDWKNRNQNADEVIIDSSEALMSACVNTFAACKSVNTYNTECFDSLLNYTKPPTSFVRCDRSHFVKSVTHSKTLKQVSKPIQHLFLGIIGYVIQCENVDECATILHHIFTLTKNEYVTGDVISAQNFLYKLVKPHDFEMDESEPVVRMTEPESQIDVFSDNEDLSGSDTYKDTSTYQWIMNIHSTVEVNNVDIENPIHNIYFCGKAENFVIKLFTRLPMWSNIMCEKFESNNFAPTSSASESEFKNVKRLMGIKTRKIPVFVNLHLEQLFGSLKLALANLNGINAVTEAKTSNRDMRRQLRSGSNDRFSHSFKTKVNFESPNRSRSANDLSVPNETPENEKKLNLGPPPGRRSRASSTVTEAKTVNGEMRHQHVSGSDDRSSDSFKTKVNFESPDRSHSENDPSVSNEPQENWRGRNSNSRLVRRSRASILNPHDVNYISRKLPLLRRKCCSPAENAAADQRFQRILKI